MRVRVSASVSVSVSASECVSVSASASVSVSTSAGVSVSMSVHHNGQMSPYGSRTAAWMSRYGSADRTSPYGSVLREFFNFLTILPYGS